MHRGQLIRLMLMTLQSELIQVMHDQGNIVRLDLAPNLAGSVANPRIEGVAAAIKQYPHVHLLQLIGDPLVELL